MALRRSREESARPRSDSIQQESIASTQMELGSAGAGGSKRETAAYLEAVTTA